MTPEDREWVKRIHEANKATALVVQQLSETVMQQTSRNMVLTVVVGALYAELAKVSGGENDLDEMLARVLGVIEARPDSKGHALVTADEIRNFAEVIR